MTNEPTFYERLTLAQMELKAPKGQFNSFGNYKYRSAEDILEGVKPVNSKHSLYLTLTDEVMEIGGNNYIKATATIIDTLNSENKHSVSAFAREAQTKKGMDDSQITGSTSSYARKYALNGLYLIDDTKDADTNENRQETDKRKEKQEDSERKQEQQEFYKNKKEIEDRIRAIAKATSKPYKDLLQFALDKSNERMGKEYDSINSQNMGQMIGQVKAMETALKKREGNK